MKFAVLYLLYMALFYAGYLWIFRNDVRHTWTRIYLHIGAVSSLLLPVIPGLIPINNETLYAYRLPPVTITNIRILTSDKLAEFGSWPWLETVYIAVSIVLLVRMLSGIHYIRRFSLHAFRSVLDGQVYYQSEMIKVPFSFFKTIFLPLEHGYNMDEIRSILTHEQVHVDEGHSWDNLFFELLIVAFWWNPFVYLYRNALQIVHEYQADQAVVRLHPWKDYSRFLLGHSHVGSIHPFAPSLFTHPIKKRIMMMKKMQVPQVGRMKFMALLPVFLGIIVVQSYAQNTPHKPAEPETSFTLRTTDTVVTFDPVTQSESIKIVTSEQEVFRVAEQMPRFPGCERDGESMEEKESCAQQRLLQYIYTHVRYPNDARNAGIEGTTIAQFVVAKDGSIKNIKVIRDPGKGLGQETQRVIQKMADEVVWTPGYHKGAAVDVQYTLPIKYKLSDDTKE